MFNLEEFYRAAEQGEEIDIGEVVEYLNSFEDVVIWGAGNLGTALGTKLLEYGVKISGYWDQKYEKMKECNGIVVYDNFSDQMIKKKDTTVIIMGIVNGIRSHLGQKEELLQAGYENCITGMTLYEGVVCKMKKGEPLDVKQCAGTSICNFNTCKKYVNILKNGNEEPEKVIIQVLEFVISRRCTLDCIECGQRVGRIKYEHPEKYIDYPLDRIKEDIDLIMNNLDVVGTFSIIGGEPFIHPQIADIIVHCLSKKNVGIISITTNGICKITEEMLMQMKDDRVKINFSNYTQSLSNSQKELFNSNVELVKRCGLNCNVATPVWSRIIDCTVVNEEIEESYYKETKSKCPLSASVSNGTFFACPVTELYDKLGEIDVSSDKVILDSQVDLRKKFWELLHKPYYETCKHRCGNKLVGEQVLPGVQRDCIN